MPFETANELQKLQAAIELPEVAKKPAYFAIGTLHNYQSKFEKIRRRAINAANKQLKTPALLGPEYEEKKAELNALELRPDLGFYYTIFLFDKLVDPAPNVINEMILAILSFDTLGNYLFEQQPIIIEVLDNQNGVPVKQNVTVILDEIVRRRGINVDALIHVAQQNRKHTIYFCDSTIPVNTVLPPPAVPLPTKPESPSEIISNELRSLIQHANETSAVQALKNRIAQVPFAFDVLSLQPTQKNVNDFFIMAAQMFNHAKMQDSAKLPTLDTAPYPNENASKVSTVALLQDTLPSWFVLSLIKADSEDVFNQRLAFIMAAINTATQKKPTLPPDTTADVLLPLYQFAALIHQSSLQFHPVVKGGLSHIKEIALKRSPDEINHSISPKLPPMRMYITSRLAQDSERSDMTMSSLSAAGLSQTIAELLPAPGAQPLTGAQISQITAKLSEAVAWLSRISAESFLPLGELPQISAELSSIAKGLPLHIGDAAVLSQIAAVLSQIAADLTPIAEKLSPIAEAKKIITQGKLIYTYFNPEHHMVSKPQPPMSNDAPDVFKQQSTVKVLFEEADFRDMQNLLASTFIVFQPDKSIGRQLSALDNCLNLDSPRIYSLRDKMFFKESSALDFIARQAKRISNQVSSQDEEYKKAVQAWCATILNTCQQALDLASGQMLAERCSASSQDGGSRTLLDFFRRRRVRATSEPPLPKRSLDHAPRACDFKVSVSCPASVAGVRRASYFAPSRVGSAADKSSLSDQVFSQCKK